MKNSMQIRNCVIPVRFTEAEREYLYELGKAHSLRLSGLIRQLALKKRLPPPRVPEVNLSTYKELCRMGSNLNQIARALNKWQLKESYLSQILELKKLLKQVSFEVLGEACDS